MKLENFERAKQIVADINDRKVFLEKIHRSGLRVELFYHDDKWGWCSIDKISVNAQVGKSEFAPYASKMVDEIIQLSSDRITELINELERL